jgi:hypothetical protein
MRKLVWPKDLKDWHDVDTKYTYRVIMPIGEYGLGGGWYFVKKPLWHEKYGWYSDLAGRSFTDNIASAGVTDNEKAMKNWHKRIQRRPKNDPGHFLILL